MYGECTRNRILALANANKTPTEIASILCKEKNNSRKNYTAKQGKKGQQREDRLGQLPKPSSAVKRKIDEVGS